MWGAPLRPARAPCRSFPWRANTKRGGARTQAWCMSCAASNGSAHPWLGPEPLGEVGDADRPHHEAVDREGGEGAGLEPAHEEADGEVGGDAAHHDTDRDLSMDVVSG